MTPVYVLTAITVLTVGYLLVARWDSHRHMSPRVRPLPMTWQPPKDRDVPGGRDD